ncbi:hypothetical protein LTR70_007252 [Exophiala xenobiotica]|uniref:Uncharacterized protein n=1 Tax=Lithohypha guttulata TaxID=1690604 RepID=A0ABR0K583_9EURO|nr:hypothetical protein LTR24_006836 [Lithohypha guttulata]KAK5314278.1 hypothetical protein LTR70_007252 [Exophiala xenobiotica]
MFVKHIVSLLTFSLILLTGQVFASPDNEEQGTMSSNSMNVFKQPLKFFSNKPVTGFYRDGYCRTGAQDFGNHAVAGVVTEDFLDYSASQGNDLRIVGLKEGCKWCLCTSRWLEAFVAYKDGRVGQNAVPKVDLEATEDSALRKVDLDTFKKFAAKSEQQGSSEL